MQNALRPGRVSRTIIRVRAMPTLTAAQRQAVVPAVRNHSDADESIVRRLSRRPTGSLTVRAACSK